VLSWRLESLTENRLEDVSTDVCAVTFHNMDMQLDPRSGPLKHAVQQLVSQEAGRVFGEKYADCD
jgi:hypothetical protein